MLVYSKLNVIIISASISILYLYSNMKSTTHVQPIPMFLTKESSDSVIPNEDDGFCKNNNVIKLKYHCAIEPKTKSRVGRHKLRRANKSSTRLEQNSILQASYRRNALSHISNDSRSQSKSSSKSIPHNQNIIIPSKKGKMNVLARKKFFEMIENFKICETFLSFLGLTDLLNFNFIIKKNIYSQSYSFLVKKQTESSLSLGTFIDDRRTLWESITRLNSNFLPIIEREYAQLTSDSVISRVTKIIKANYPRLGHFKSLARIISLVTSVMKEETPTMKVMNFILEKHQLYKILDNHATTLSDLFRSFDYAIEKIIPKALIKLRMASLYSQISGQTLCESFATSWFTSLFANELSDHFALQVLDMFLLGGWAYIFRVGLTFIKLNEEAILKSPFEDVYNLLYRIISPKCKDSVVLNELRSIELKSDVELRINQIFEKQSTSESPIAHLKQRKSSVLWA